MFQNANLTIQKNMTLTELNDHIASTLIPAMMIVGILMIVGTVGNSIVLSVFYRKMPKTTQNALVLCLAVSDLLSCTVAMPTEIVDMRQFFTFQAEVACKMLRFVNTLTAITSILILLVIALDRYQNVLRPFQPQMSIRSAHRNTILAVLCSIMFSWPALVLYGIHHKDVGIPGQYGRDCSTSDEVRNTAYPLIYNIVLFLCFTVISVVLIIIYTRIIRETRRHFKYLRATSDYYISGFVATSTTSPAIAIKSETSQTLQDYYVRTSYENSKRDINDTMNSRDSKGMTASAKSQLQWKAPSKIRDGDLSLVHRRFLQGRSKAKYFISVHANREIGDIYYTRERLCWEKSVSTPDFYTISMKTDLRSRDIQSEGIPNPVALKRFLGKPNGRTKIRVCYSEEDFVRHIYGNYKGYKHRDQARNSCPQIRNSNSGENGFMNQTEKAESPPKVELSRNSQSDSGGICCQSGASAEDKVSTKSSPFCFPGYEMCLQIGDRKPSLTSCNVPINHENQHEESVNNQPKQVPYIHTESTESLPRAAAFYLSQSDEDIPFAGNDKLSRGSTLTMCSQCQTNYIQNPDIVTAERSGTNNIHSELAEQRNTSVYDPVHNKHDQISGTNKKQVVPVDYAEVTGASLDSQETANCTTDSSTDQYSTLYNYSTTQGTALTMANNLHNHSTTQGRTLTKETTANFPVAVQQKCMLDAQITSLYNVKDFVNNQEQLCLQASMESTTNENLNEQHHNITSTDTSSKSLTTVTDSMCCRNKEKSCPRIKALNLTALKCPHSKLNLTCIYSEDSADLQSEMCSICKMSQLKSQKDMSHQATPGNSLQSNKQQTPSTSEMEVEQDQSSQHNSPSLNHTSPTLSDNWTNLPSDPVDSSAQSSSATSIALWVTIVFIISFLPHLCLMLARVLKPDLEQNLTGSNLVLFNIFLRSYLVNSALNPIVYGWLNRQFRQICCQMFWTRHFWCLKK